MLREQCVNALKKQVRGERESESWANGTQEASSGFV